MTQVKKGNWISSVAGLVYLGFASALVGAGLVLENVEMIIATLVIGTVGILLPYFVIKRFPERKHAAVGMTLLWLVLANLIFFNYIYTKMNELANTFVSGYSFLSPFSFSITFLLAALVGFYFILRDMIAAGKTPPSYSH